jgi:RimJ/RimL family protein N-acetyltransferase
VGPGGGFAPAGGEPGFRVRPARPRDAASFAKLLTVVVREGKYIRTEEVGRDLRSVRRRFRESWDEEHAWLVAVGDADGRVVGSLSIAREDHAITRHVASIGMMVAPEWRVRGVGSALMVAAIDWAERMGVEKLALSVYPDNAPARALYRKFGFVEEGRLAGHSKKAIGYRDEIVMGRWLIDPPDGGADDVPGAAP